MTSVERVKAELSRVVDRWYEDQRAKDGSVNRNVMTVALVMLDHLKRRYPLEEEDWFTGSQVQGLSGRKIKSILAAHGEMRILASEGGRTSRGSQQRAKSFLEAIEKSAVAGDLAHLEDEKRAEVVAHLQQEMVDRVRRDFFDRQRLEPVLDLSHSSVRLVDEILRVAVDRGGNTAGAVAQHLVGAALASQYPAVEVENHSYTTADQQTGRSGDFIIADTAIHVTMSPTESLIDKCKANLRNGLRVLVVVPEDKLVAVKVLADNAGISDEVSARSVQQFVADAIDNLSAFSKKNLPVALRVLLETYNERVGAVEADKSLQIDLPDNL